MNRRIVRLTTCSAVVFLAVIPVSAQQEQIVKVQLAYQAPGNGPRTDFSPHGTQVKLVDVPEDASLPEGATRPARTGTMEIGPGEASWLQILVTADPAHPRDLCRLYIDGKRKGNFDDATRIAATPAQNAKTKAWWSSFNDIEVTVPYERGGAQPYMVNFWTVREGEEPPSVIRYSVGSWRSGRVTVDGIDALVAVMDANNDAMFDPSDDWAVLGAAEQNAAQRVLSYREARPSNRLMFLPKPDGKELVLEFRDITPDGRVLTFAVVDRKVTKAEDRAPDDTLAAERARPRTAQPFPWIEGDFDRGMAQARATNRNLIVDFWTSWCMPCRQLDQWIWTDAEVAGVLNERYVGVKLDGDLEKNLAARFHVEGYPTVVILDGSGNEIKRIGYMPSKEMLKTLK